MTGYEELDENAMEAALTKAVENGIENIVQKTTNGNPEHYKAYEGIKSPILSRLLMMENEQAFEIRLGSAETANAFVAGFNEYAPKTSQYIYGAILEGETTVSLKRMEPIGFVLNENGEATPL